MWRFSHTNENQCMKCKRGLRQHSTNVCVCVCRGWYGGIKQTASINPPPSCVQLWAPAPRWIGQDAPFSRLSLPKEKKGCIYMRVHHFPQNACFPWVIRNKWDVRCWSLSRKARTCTYTHTHTFGEEVYFRVWTARTTHRRNPYSAHTHTHQLSSV